MWHYQLRGPVVSDEGNVLLCTVLKFQLKSWAVYTTSTVRLSHISSSCHPSSCWTWWRCEWNAAVQHTWVKTILACDLMDSQVQSHRLVGSVARQDEAHFHTHLSPVPTKMADDPWAAYAEISIQLWSESGVVLQI